MDNPFVMKLSGLAKLSAEDISAIETITRRSKPYDPQQDLICEGDQTGPMFVVLDGWVCRYKILPNGSRQIIAFLMPGDACDLNIKLLAQMDHSIQTITCATVATVHKSDMETLMLAHPNVAVAMYSAQLVDEGVLRAWIVSMGRRTGLEKTAHLLCELYLRLRNIQGTQQGEITFPLSQAVLADTLGLTPVYVNRVLMKLRKANAISVSRLSVSILDPENLIEIAGFDENYLHRKTDAAT